eukprot:UC4_evm2s541
MTSGTPSRCIDSLVHQTVSRNWSSISSCKYNTSPPPSQNMIGKIVYLYEKKLCAPQVGPFAPPIFTRVSYIHVASSFCFFPRLRLPFAFVKFIIRYRRDYTGGAGEEEVLATIDALAQVRNLLTAQDKAVQMVRRSGAWTHRLDRAIRAAIDTSELDELIASYKPSKAKSFAAESRALDLGLIAEALFEGQITYAALISKAKTHIDRNGRLVGKSNALRGIGYILSDICLAIAGLRQTALDCYLAIARLYSTKSRKLKYIDGKGLMNTTPFLKFMDNFSRPVTSLAPHTILAINRGSKKGILCVSIKGDDNRIERLVLAKIREKNNISRGFLWDPKTYKFIQTSAKDAVHRLLIPYLKRWTKRFLADRAELAALESHKISLRSMLLARGVKGEALIGIDPGLKHGCKYAVINTCGEVMDSGVIYPNPPQKLVKDSSKKLKSLAKRFGAYTFSIGNGNGHREFCDFFSIEISPSDKRFRYTIVSEAGVSIYSISAAAKKEFPGMDPSLRGAVSIARRLQNPLSELIKCEPSTIGVGMYQKDVKESKLKKSADRVVESCVAFVGVDLNTASSWLLRATPGISSRLAEEIVAHRSEFGPFKCRSDIRDVKGIGHKVFNISAGFLRVFGGTEPLDETEVHPENYDIARIILSKALTNKNISKSEALNYWAASREGLFVLSNRKDKYFGPEMASQIIDMLVAPNDPRDNHTLPTFRKGIIRLVDVKPGMQLSGVIRNVVDFGCFVDCGLESDGLLHKSNIENLNGIEVGNVINVEVNNVEPRVGRLSLSMMAGTKRKSVDIISEGAKKVRHRI